MATELQSGRRGAGKSAEGRWSQSGEKETTMSAMMETLEELKAYEADDDAGAWMTTGRDDQGVAVVVHSAEVVRLQQSAPASGVSR